MCLLIGPSSVGKTLLLKRLTTDESEVAATVPSIGTSLVKVQLSRRKSVTVRELGGCMAPIWADYFGDSAAIIFVVDAANLLQVGAASMQFIELLNSTSTQACRILLLFNKIDLINDTDKKKLQHLFMLEDILRHARQEIVVLEASAVTRQGFPSLKEWLEQVADC